MAKKISRTCRLGEKFLKRIDEIKIERVKLKKDPVNKPLSIEKITNLVVRHSAWPDIEEKIIKATKEEVESFA